MTAYKFTAHQHLRDILNNVETVQKSDIRSYAGGHLNESLLHKPQTEWASQNWNKTSPLPSPRKEPHPPQKSRNSGTNEHMRDVLYDFSVGTSGTLPKRKGLLRSPRRFTDSRPISTQRCPTASSPASVYTELEKDGVNVEELRAEEMMLPSSRPLHVKKLPPLDDSEYNIMEEITKSLNEEGLLTFRHNFLPTYHVGVTKKDQFSKLMDFEEDVLKKKESSEKKVLSGEKAVKHIEDKLVSDLESMNFLDTGPNFHKLQIYSNVFEDMIDESPTFTFILRSIKASILKPKT